MTLLNNFSSGDSLPLATVLTFLALRFTVMPQKHPGGKCAVIYVPERSVSCVHTKHSPWLSWGDVFHDESLHDWLLRWCHHGWWLILDITQNIKLMLGLCQCAAWLSPHLTKKKVCRKARPDSTESRSNLLCTYLSPAAVISCMRSATREDFGTWVAMSERFAGPDAKAPWRPKMETEKNFPCSSKGTCPHDTRLNPRQCLLKSQTNNRRSSLPAVAALQEKHLFSVLQINHSIQE